MIRAITRRLWNYARESCLRAWLLTPQHNGGLQIRRVFLPRVSPVCTENLVRVDDVMELPKLAE